MHEAFAAAVEQRPREGMPANPRAWLICPGRFDAMRRRARFDASQVEVAERLEEQAMRSIPGEGEDIASPSEARGRATHQLLGEGWVNERG